MLPTLIKPGDDAVLDCNLKVDYNSVVSGAIVQQYIVPKYVVSLQTPVDVAQQGLIPEPSSPGSRYFFMASAVAVVRDGNGVILMVVPAFTCKMETSNHLIAQDIRSWTNDKRAIRGALSRLEHWARYESPTVFSILRVSDLFHAGSCIPNVKSYFSTIGFNAQNWIELKEIR